MPIVIHLFVLLYRSNNDSDTQRTGSKRNLWSMTCEPPGCELSDIGPSPTLDHFRGHVSMLANALSAVLSSCALLGHSILDEAVHRVERALPHEHRLSRKQSSFSEASVK